MPSDNKSTVWLNLAHISEGKGKMGWDGMGWEGKEWDGMVWDGGVQNKAGQYATQERTGHQITQ
jgi:hypothetical protein